MSATNNQPIARPITVKTIQEDWKPDGHAHCAVTHGSALSSCHCPRCGKLKLTRTGKQHKCAVLNWRAELELALNELMRVAQNARRDGSDCAADYIEYADRGLRNFTVPNNQGQTRSVEKA